MAPSLAYGLQVATYPFCGAHKCHFADLTDAVQCVCVNAVGGNTALKAAYPILRTLEFHFAVLTDAFQCARVDAAGADHKNMFASLCMLLCCCPLHMSN